MNKPTVFTTLWVGALLAVIAGCDESPQASDAASHAQTVAEPAVEAPALAKPQRQPDEFLEPVPPTRPAEQMTLTCKATDQPPTVDGQADDAAWQGASPITTLDYSSQRPITLRAVHYADEIFVLATFPDAAPSETHKSWIWDEQARAYKMGNDREDAFVLKWSMVGNDVDLSFHDAEPHIADVWFWKACRTNASGYLDDKIQYLSSDPTDKNVLPIPSNQQEQLYLTRKGDTGTAAYVDHIPGEYAGDVLLKYLSRQPEGSRADIRGRGVWEDGRWVIEIRRKLDTGHDDDLALKVGGEYLWGLGS